MTDLRLFALPALSDNYIWLLADAAGAALVVDPGEAAPVRAALESEGLRLRAILLTHHHGDHVAGADELAREWKAAVWSPVDRRIRSDHPVAGGERVEQGEPEVSFVVIEVLEGDKRPVAAVADHDEARNVRRVEVLSDKTIAMRMLFDPGHSLEERILSEQFGY